MDFKMLKTFQTVVKYGSFNRAADELNYVQSTVTMQIQRLEAELGAQLIDRGKGFRLTEAGRLFYEQSLGIIRSMEQLQTRVSDVSLGDAGHIRLGITEPTASYRMPGILKGFMNDHPHIRISLEMLTTPILCERILKGDLDLALCTAPDMGTDLRYEPLFQEDFVVFMPNDSSLAGRDVIEPEDLQGHRLLITSLGCPYRRKLEMVMQERGIVTLDTMEIGSMTALKSYVESGFGIALLPRILVQPLPQGTTVREIHGDLIHMTLGLVCKESEFPLRQAAHKLYRYLKEKLLVSDSSKADRLA